MSDLNFKIALFWENQRKYLSSKSILIVVMVTLFIKVFIPMAENNIEQYRFFKQSKEIQNSEEIVGKAISVKTVFTDIQPIPRILPNIRVHGREVFMQYQVGDKIYLTKASTWSKTQSVFQGNEYKIRINPSIRRESEMINGSLFNNSLFYSLISITFLSLLLIIYIISLVIVLPHRFENLMSREKLFILIPIFVIILIVSFLYINILQIVS